uniref:Uncharacterized protein n=1 Tax=Anopheles minimus TaxID=112268 RepID=A0A182WNF1_9DIPT
TSLWIVLCRFLCLPAEKRHFSSSSNSYLLQILILSQPPFKKPLPIYFLSAVCTYSEGNSLLLLLLRLLCI